MNTPLAFSVDRFLARNSRALALAALGLLIFLGGCAAEPPASATISHAKHITLYEGLPHPVDQPRALLAEKKNKSTVDRAGYPFYSETLELNEQDAQELRRLLASTATFAPVTSEKKCGGFHPDFALVWSIGDKVYRCLICFGCEEANIDGPTGKTKYDIDHKSAQRLKELLTPYRKNRPPATLEMGMATPSGPRQIDGSDRMSAAGRLPGGQVA